MAGNKAGGIKASITNKKKYGDDFYKQIGAKGGQKSKGGGFASETVGKDGLTGSERARLVGAKGGEASKRSKATREQLHKEKEVLEYTIKNKQEKDWQDWREKHL